MLAWAGTACTLAKWCLLIAVGSTARATRPTSNSLWWYATKLRNGHNHLGVAVLVRHHLRGSWRPRSRIEHEHRQKATKDCQTLLWCSITCGRSHVLGYMNFWPTRFSWSLHHANRGAGDSPTDTGSVLLHGVSDFRCTNHLSVYQ